ncbi:hypothetical protein [Clostridium sp. ZS1]|uniref:hypothetical protein n=1 Tax=Clostridium sp. ZS1 TaxID=2949989 RepID=UPI00207A03D9|nr:hypothetical protein [Clostridium sp. ZS1]
MSKRLIINKLIIEGDKYKRTLPFVEGLNIIEGEMYSGKSLVLKLINYLLGKDEKIRSNVQKELKEYCDKALLEIQVYENILTIERNLWDNTSKVMVYFCDVDNIENFSPRIFELDKYYSFLLEKMNIPEYSNIKYKMHSKEKTIEKVSFRDIMRYIFVDQHSLGTYYFMKYNDGTFKKKNNLIFKILFNLIRYDNDDILNRIKDTQNAIEKARREIEGLESYIHEMNVINKLELIELYEKYKNDVAKYKEEKKRILDEEDSYQKRQNNLYRKTKTKIIELENKFSFISQQEGELILGQIRKKELLEDYNKELDELRATSEAYNIISKKEQKYACPLCSNTISYEFNESVNLLSIDDSINELDTKIHMIEYSLNSTTEKIQRLQKEKVLLEEDLSIYNKALIKYMESLNVAYVPELESINLILIQINEKLNKINENIKIINKIEEKRNFIIEKSEVLKSLEKERKELEVEEKDEKKIIDDLSSIYRDIMKEFKLNISTLNTYINYNTYLPFYENASILEHESGGILVCMQIAYLASILKYQKDNEEVKHPGLLILDTIGKYLGTTLEANNENYTEDMIMDPITYNELHKLLINISNDFQIFVVDNIPPKISEPYVEFVFYHNGLRGLIDISKNEKKQ